MKIFGFKRVKSRKCKVCRNPFQPRSMTHKACSPSCAAELAKKERLKREAKELRERKLAIKPLSYWADKAQAAVNAWIRERDKLDGCISCGIRTGKMNAGHYRSRGAMSALRFHPDNIHKQCEQCNTSKSGNSIEYRIRLLAKIGADRLAFLEGPHEPKRYRKEELRQIEAEYKAKLRQLKGS